MMKFVQNHYQFFQNDRRLIPDDKVILRTAMLAVKKSISFQNADTFNFDQLIFLFHLS